MQGSIYRKSFTIRQSFGATIGGSFIEPSSAVMRRLILALVLAAAPGAALAQGFDYGDPPSATPAPRGNLGGGFIEFLFTGGEMASQPAYRPVPTYRSRQIGAYGAPAGLSRRDRYAYALPPSATPDAPAPARVARPVRAEMDARFLPQEVAFDGSQKPGTIVIDTSERFLYLVEADGRAMRYGVGVGREGFEWKGTKTIERKAEWPDWRPPSEMLKRRPDLPTFMAGGPDNPLGARAMYLAGTLYRIHGSNEPWSIGQAVSSGCIRMRNEDVIDLYGRVPVGTTVVVM
jgi:lipoprotein-anchoring transpeptidase ErfK/SrfK